jgi:hypothetical protein
MYNEANSSVKLRTIYFQNDIFPLDGNQRIELKEYENFEYGFNFGAPSLDDDYWYLFGKGTWEVTGEKSVTFTFTQLKRYDRHCGEGLDLLKGESRKHEWFPEMEQTSLSEHILVTFQYFKKINKRMY